MGVYYSLVKFHPVLTVGSQVMQFQRSDTQAGSDNSSLHFDQFVFGLPEGVSGVSGG